MDEHKFDDLALMPSKNKLTLFNFCLYDANIKFTTANPRKYNSIADGT